MNNKQNIFLLISLLLLALTASCTVVFPGGNKATGNDGQTGICNYDIPKGYTEQFQVSLADMNIISLVGEEESSHIYLVGLPDGVDINLSENPVGVLVGRTDNGRQALQTVDMQTVTIQDQQVTLVINEGKNGNNEQFREASAVFQHNTGQVLVNISSTISNWDQEMVTKFLTSIN